VARRAPGAAPRRARPAHSVERGGCDVMTSSAVPPTDLRLVPPLREPAPGHDAEVRVLTPVPDAATRPPVVPRPLIRTLVVDSQRLMRAGVRVLLEDQPDVTVTAEAASGDEAVEIALRTRPHVVVMDAALDGLDGLEATRRILAQAPAGSIKVLLLTADGTDADIVEALQAGATGLLVKDSDAGELVRAVRAVAAGDALLSPRLMTRVIAQFVSLAPRSGPSPEALAELTAREREVMALVAAGLSNGEIAQRLVVSPATAKTHVSRVLRKLDARDRAQLVVLAYETGLVASRPDAAAPDDGGRA
jgi:DNA-binding NarL/FixJ family response regulator